MTTEQGGTLTLVYCNIINNQARSGGGIRARNLIQVTIHNTTISNNRSISGGAGIDMNDSNVTLTNTTVSNNVATSLFAASAGGIMAMNTRLYLFNSTVYNNSAATGEATSTGGIRTSGIGNSAFANSIVAKNSGVHPDSYGPLSSGYGCLIGAYNGFAFNNPEGGNIVGTLAAPINPLLGELQNNGGKVLTHALLPGSPALNAGKNNYNFAQQIDARRYQRVVDGTVDIGAYEANAVPSVYLMDATGLITAGQQRVRGAIITMTNERGEVRYAITNPWGYYRFKDVPRFETYIIEATHKKYRFTPYVTIGRVVGHNFVAQ